ncbi:hypothetical protein ACEWY4_009751 [Coilia grayii]|uniref:Uncharacterized protein n=1 Tax=Coilia grayii TaxID=363190 RepID=A0ABD1K7B3_9TELE
MQYGLGRGVAQTVSGLILQMSRYLLRLAGLPTIKEISSRGHSIPNSSLRIYSHRQCPHLRASSTCTMVLKIHVIYCGG